MFKMFFIRMLAAIAEASGGAVQVLTSDKLTDLQNQYKTAWAAMLQMTDPFSKETKDAKLAVWKIEGEIKAEEAHLQKLVNDAKIAEQRNARLALNTTMLDAFRTLIGLQNDKKSDPAKVAEAETAFNTAKDAVDNELLAKYAASKSAKVTAAATDGESKEASNANTAAIVELFVAGKTHKEIEEIGYKRSTVWHAIDKYKKANGITA